MKQKPSPLASAKPRFKPGAEPGSQGQPLAFVRASFLAPKMALMMILTVKSLSLPAQAHLSVVDWKNLAQSRQTTMECIKQTYEQIKQTHQLIEQHKIQLKQYENMIQNTLQPEAYVWTQAEPTINALVNTVDTLNYYKGQLGSIDAYLGKFQDVAYYERSPCFSPAGCSDTEYAALTENRRLASESQKKANDAVFRALDQQQNTLRNDAMALQRLQSSAQGAKGQMQAIGYANQLASQQVHQLLQIRGLLIAQQNAITMHMQAQNDRTALEIASSEKFLRRKYRPSPPHSW